MVIVHFLKPLLHATVQSTSTGASSWGTAKARGSGSTIETALECPGSARITFRSKAAWCQCTQRQAPGASTGRTAAAPPGKPALGSRGWSTWEAAGGECLATVLGMLPAPTKKNHTENREAALGLLTESREALTAYLQVNTTAQEPSPAADWNHTEASTQVPGAGLAWRNTSPPDQRASSTILLLRKRERKSLGLEINVTSKEETGSLLEKCWALSHIP